MKKLFLVSALTFMASPAFAEFYETPYTQSAIILNDQLKGIAEARGLSVVEASQAKRLASAWFAAGPCKQANVNDAEAAIQIVMSPNPKAGLHAAILEMVAVFSSPNLGREPSEMVCKFVQDMASS